jgi:serine O-acetyltransferase
MSRLALAIYRFACWLHKLRVPVLPAIINKCLVRLLFGCQIGLGASIGRGVILSYGGLGVVIHHRAVIGDRVTVGTNVTIGGTSKQYEVPIIGENTLIATGAKILGHVKIGKNCVIGANAVVVHDVPDCCVVGGVPAKIIKTGIDIADYM